MSLKKYSGKLLLFGEYTIIKGGPALAQPLPLYQAQWQWAKEGSASHLQQQLSAWCKHLKQLDQDGQLLCQLDLEAFQQDLQHGIYFESNIPGGYGAGSSGALCAGVYDRYGLEKKDTSDTDGLAQLKTQLAQLESFFHGSSSGVDPLVCYVDRPLLFSATATPIRFFEANGTLSSPASFFLIDTGISRQTAPLVNIFLEKCKEPHYEDRLIAELIPSTEEAIHYLADANAEALLSSIHQIGYFQQRYFLPMIPEAYRSLWLAALSSNDYKLKLCGAGGGGFILGFTTDYLKLSRQLNQLQLKRI